MSVASLDPSDLRAYVERVKTAWREHEHTMTWEEKIAAIERMREREQQLKKAREGVKLPRD
jgi:hypothetical protein